MSIQDKIQRLQTAKEDIATAIAAKGGAVGENDGFEEFSSDIGTIETGITPSGELSITENGSYDVTEYASADVDVAQDFTVSEDYTVSEGKLTSADVQLVGDVVATIPDGVVTIGNKAFMGNEVINKVVMPNSVTTIENGVFQYPGSPDNAMAFDGCLNLKEIIWSNNLTSIGDSAFYNCSNLALTALPDGLTSIGDSAFESCSNLALTALPDGLTSIGDSAFRGCTSLTSITIPNSVTSIGEHAFSYCTSLTSITIPDSVTSVGDNAFNGCTSLTSITIPDSVTSIGNSAFGGCTSLTDIYYTGTQAEWGSITGIGSAGIPGGATIHYEYTPAE